MIQLEILDLPITDCTKNFEIEKNLGNNVTDNKWILRFWQNEPSIILGRFQREEFEIMPQFIQENNIKICRRETGGGTVYHDLGTLNVSFTRPKNPPLKKGVKDASVCAQIITDSIASLGLSPTLNDRNAIFIDENKIMGSAASLLSNISLFHCSILFDTNLDNLTKSINWNPDYDESDKVYVKSHRSPVINLRDLQPTLTLDNLKLTIKNQFIKFIDTYNKG